MSSSVSWRLYLLLGAPVVAAVYYVVCLVRGYRLLAPVIPVHFDINGQPNGWMGKSAYAGLALGLVIGMLALFTFLLSVLGQRPETLRPFLYIYSASFGLLIGALSGQLLASSSGNAFRMAPALIWEIALAAVEAGVLQVIGSKIFS